MTEEKFYEGMCRMLDNLEKLSVMYWHYKRELDTFDFICDLAYESKHLSKKNYDRIKNVIKGELNKYV